MTGKAGTVHTGQIGRLTQSGNCWAHPGSTSRVASRENFTLRPRGAIGRRWIGAGHGVGGLGRTADVMQTEQPVKLVSAAKCDWR